MTRTADQIIQTDLGMADIFRNAFKATVKDGNGVYRAADARQQEPASAATCATPWMKVASAPASDPLVEQVYRGLAMQREGALRMIQGLHERSSHEAHPAAALFPMPTDEALADLAEDIRLYGQRDPIIMLDGKILDGRSRYIACQVAGVKPRMARAGQDLREDPVSYALSANLHRRHLTAEQRAAIVIKAAELSGELDRLKAEAEAREKAGGTLGPHEPRVAAKLAEKAKVSPATVKRVQRAAKVDPTALERIKAGETTSGKILQSTTAAEVERSAKRKISPSRIARDAWKVLELLDEITRDGGLTPAGMKLLMLEPVTSEQIALVERTASWLQTLHGLMSAGADE